MAEKKSTTTKKPTSTTKKATTTKKTTTTKKPTTTTKKATTAKKPVAETTKSTTTVKKTATKKPTTTKTSTTTKKPSTAKKTVPAATKDTTAVKTTPTETSTTSKKSTKKKAAPKKVKTEKKPRVKKTSKEKTTAENKKKDVKKLTPSKAPKKPKKEKKEKKPRVKKTAKQIQEEIVSKEAVENVFENKVKQRPRFDKRFYLVFSVLFYAAAFFYINNVVYDNNDYLQSALFALALLMVVFVLLYFNIHGIVLKFFKLPLDYLLEQARLEYRKDLIVEDEKTGIRKRIGRYRTIFTLVLYGLVFLVLVGSQVYNGIMDADKILVIVTQSLATGGIYLMILCAWQYIFNIIPNLLENSIDAKSGFVLTLTAVILVVYVIFMLFDITYLEELMIFILIVGFVSLLGVNLNMIIGEFNIFKNIRNKKGQSKAVTRAVFMIFFSFHLYIIIYASVVAYSIYDQNNDTYIFANPEYDIQLIHDVEFEGDVVTGVYDGLGTKINRVYYQDGGEIIDFFEHGKYVTEYYDRDGNPIFDFYSVDGFLIHSVQKGEDSFGMFHEFSSHYFVFYQGTLKGVEIKEVQHGYSDLLYYAVITISSIGYGDIHPNTNYLLPQFWGGFLSIYGITFYALSIGYVSNIAFMGISESKESEKNDQ